MSPSYVSIADRLPAQVRRGFLTGGLVVPDGKYALYKQSFPWALELVKALHTANVPMVCGADLVVVDGDPLARIEDIRKVRTTVRGGVGYPVAELYEAIGVRR